MLGLAASSLIDDQRRWFVETRSAWLRLIVLATLAVNLALAPGHGDYLVHSNVVVGYALVTAPALVLARLKRGSRWLAAGFVTVDAMLVVVLFHEHLFTTTSELDHSLTAPSLAIGFVLLTHVALRLNPRLVLLFSSVVVVGWLSLMAVAVDAHLVDGTSSEIDWKSFSVEAGLATTFGFAAFVCSLLTYDHNVLLRNAVASERSRVNLSRFFPPNVLSQLEQTGQSLELARRQVAVMFVDLRLFTRFTESAPPEQVAEILAEYREHVTSAVFAYGGTVDKFIGDGVMAVFGQPWSGSDDVGRALDCAVSLASSLEQWRESRLRKGKQALEAGIGLHAGTALGGILRSGSHAEFTLFGDVVNVAERLERLCKDLDASLVTSDTVMASLPRWSKDDEWRWKDDTALEGRTGRLRIAYRPRLGRASTPSRNRRGSYEDASSRRSAGM